MNIKNARFCFNNYLESGAFSASSSQSDYPASNLYSTIRGDVWKNNGNFQISSENNKVYINGSTFTLTSGNYTSATLITHFNSVTSQTLTRNLLGKFVITLGSSGTLNLSSQTNAVWETLGFLGTSDLTGTAFTADDRRYNNGEWLKVDMLIPQTVTFACLLPAAEEVFSASSATSILLQGNNIDDWTSPIESIAMTVNDAGAFAAPSEDAVTPCRYWRIKINDWKNSEISAAVGYIGSSTVTEDTNISIGFSRRYVDLSQKLYSESGQLYVDRKPRLRVIESVNMLYLKDDDLEAMEQLVYDLRQGTPFILCIDPSTAVSRSLDHLTFYVQVEGDPVFTHVLRGYHNLSFSLRELV